MSYIYTKTISSTVDSETLYNEIDAEVFEFRHNTTETPLFAVKNDDPNKTFTVSFRTLPENSPGVAHVLEHTVLSGSRKFQLKDVFNEI